MTYTQGIIRGIERRHMRRPIGIRDIERGLRGDSEKPGMDRALK